MSELKNKFIHSVTWTAGSNVGGFLINFFLGIWLARILGPEAYGLIGMVMVIIGFGRLFMDFGFGEALIQNQNVKDEDFSSVFWFNILVAFVLFLVFFLLSGFIANFYNQPSLKPISQVISLVFILNALGIVQRIKLEKEIKFKLIGVTELLSSLISIIIALIFAFNDYGVWSLVYLNLIKPATYSLFIWAFSKWLPMFTFKWDSLLKLSRFSFALLLNGVLETIASTLDKILIGKNFGDVKLGIYSKSYSTVRMPVMQVMSAIGRVVFPSFASIQSDDNRIFSIYKKIVVIISTIILPIMVVFYFFSSELILIIFGIKWIDMIPGFAIMSLTAWFIPFNILADNVVKAKGNVKYLNFITFFEKPITILSIIVGIVLGSLNTVFISITVAVFIVFLVKSFIVCQCLSQSFSMLIIQHLKTLYVVLLPIICLLIFPIFFGLEHLHLKILMTAISFMISLFLFRNSLLLPFYEFIKLYRKK